VWHLGLRGQPEPAYTGTLNFSLVLNLISALGAGDHALLWQYLRRYDPAVNENRAIVETMVDRAVAYFKDYIEPQKKYRPATAAERPLFEALLTRLEAYPGEDEAELQAMVFDVARERQVDPKEFFASIYEVLLGQERGPRFGTFVRLVGKERICAMLTKALAESGPEPS
jgi:lysyl-tRNA synthetase class 1